MESSTCNNMAMVCAYETRVSSIPWNFSPVLDLGLDPRSKTILTFWGRPIISKNIWQQGLEVTKVKIANDRTKIAACMNTL